MQIFTSKRVRFNENNLRGFHIESADIEVNFLKLEADGKKRRNSEY